MSVDFSQYQETKIGEKERTAVISVVEGIQSDFRTEKYWDATSLTKQEIEDAKKQKAIEVRTANGASMVLNLPAANKINPKSKLAQFKKTYGKYPEEGMTIETKVDENGFNKVVLEV